jgi:hypothetical protein
MQGDGPANARARQLLDACSRTITVTRVQAGAGVNAFRVETSAFPELHAGVPVAGVPAASDEVPTFFYENGIKTPENFNVDGGNGKMCLVCANDLIGDELGEALPVDQSVTLRQLMCMQLQPGTGAMQPVHWLGGGHFFPHACHSPCIEKWFVTKLQEHQLPTCPKCRCVFGNQMVRSWPPQPPVLQEPLVRLFFAACRTLTLSEGVRLRACNLSRSPSHPAHSRCTAPPERAAGPGAHRRSHGGKSKRDSSGSGADLLPVAATL